MKPAKSFCLAVVLLGLLAQPALAADKWISVRTKNFFLAGSASEQTIRSVGRYLEEYRSALAILFPKVEQSSSVPTTVIIFKNDDGFKPYKPLRDGKPVDVLALFQKGDDANYIALSSALSFPTAVLHEYIHFLTRDTAGWLPLWASEGLAESYSTFDMGKANEFTLGRAPERHVALLNQGKLLPLRTLFAVDHSSPYYNEEAKQGIFYAESWALVHYLILGAEGKRRPQFVQFMGRLAKGDPIEDSFTEAFQTDFGTLENELHDYISNRNSWPFLKVVSRDDLRVDVRSITTTPLTEAQSEYYLGDLLLHMNRLPEAETHLTIASRDPALIAAQASLGVLRVRQNKYDEAQTLLKKAVESDAKNYIVNYYYAYALAHSGGETPVAPLGERYETVRGYLKKSIELAPRFVEAHGMLSRIDLAEGQNLDEAESLLRKALAVSPGREDLQLLLARTYLRANKTADARAVLSDLERIAEDLEIRRQATALLDQTETAPLLFTEIAPEIPKPAAKENPADVKPPDPGLPPVPTRTGAVLESLTPTAPAVEGEKMAGQLIFLDCADGLTLRVRNDKDTYEFHSSEPDKIQFLSYTAGVSNNVACGPRPGTPVSITYRPGPGSGGEPLVVEFTEAN